MKPYKTLLRFSVITTVCLLALDAMPEQEGFKWQWPYLLHAYLLPAAAYAAGIFAITGAGYFLLERVLRLPGVWRK